MALHVIRASGKSSLLRAGMMPWLCLPGGHRWGTTLALAGVPALGLPKRFRVSPTRHYGSEARNFGKVADGGNASCSRGRRLCILRVNVPYGFTCCHFSGDPQITMTTPKPLTNHLPFSPNREEDQSSYFSSLSSVSGKIELVASA
jgi:hypothetical protein